MNEYELYADERRTGPFFWLGGLICTDKGRSRLLSKLSDVRLQYNLGREMKWARVSQAYYDAYRSWADVFLSDPFARYSLFQIGYSSSEWGGFRPRPGRKSTRDDKLASAYYQFLLVTFGPLHDSKRWWVYPDAGLFSKDAVFDRVEFLFNRTYKRAFGSKSSRVIRLVRPRDSSFTDLIQLADVLLGSFTCKVLNVHPSSPAKARLVTHCSDAIDGAPTTQRGIPRLSINYWVPSSQFPYESANK
jgi:hypothetical protein